MEVRHEHEEAKRLFRAYTAGTGNIDHLYGPVKASCRAHILSALAGQRVPQSKAGWNAFRSAMFDLYGIHEDTLNSRESALRAAARDTGCLIGL